jgi:hypothetical protein
MVVRLRLVIEQELYSALLKWALSEERNPEGQLRYVLRRELEQQGWLSSDVKSTVHNEENSREIPE